MNLTKNQRIIAIAAAVLVVVWLGFVVAAKVKNRKEAQQLKQQILQQGDARFPEADEVAKSELVETQSGLMNVFPLHKGSDTRTASDDYVKNVQMICNLFDMGLVEDGVWGSKTEAAIEKIKKIYTEQNGSRNYVFAQLVSPYTDATITGAKNAITFEQYNALSRMSGTIADLDWHKDN